MKIYQVKGTPGNIVELMEMTADGKVKVRNIASNDVIETTMQAFEMAFEPADSSFAAVERVKAQAKNHKVTEKEIAEILEKSQIEIIELFGKCIVVAVQLPNGYILTESHSCVGSSDYDKEHHALLCLDRLKNRVLELEGYKQLAD